MHKLKLIHSKRTRQQRKSTNVRPRVYQEGDCISLEFPNGDIQSQMLTSDPHHLVLSYTRAMTAFPFFRENPGRIAIIGLGGGSMVKWCYRRFPDAEITVIEINPHIISLREQFHIPEDDHRLRVVQADGADYVAATNDSPEVLLVDGFDNNGQSPQLSSQQFYEHCYRALARDGVMAVNLCDGESRESLDNICRAFEGRTVIVVPEDGENRIVFAFKGKRSQGEMMPGAELARKLTEYVRIPVAIQY